VEIFGEEPKGIMARNGWKYSFLVFYLLLLGISINIFLVSESNSLTSVAVNAMLVVNHVAYSFNMNMPLGIIIRILGWLLIMLSWYFLMYL
jgi:hypothetical protein